MTLRKESKIDDKINEKEPVDVIKLEKFDRDIMELAIYLGQFYFKSNRTSYEGYVTDIHDYEKYVLRLKEDNGYNCDFRGRNFICVASGKGQSNNIFAQHVVTTIFPCNQYHPFSLGGLGYEKVLLSYGSGAFIASGWASNTDGYVNSEHSCINTWRDDLKFPNETKYVILQERLAYQKECNEVDNEPEYCWVNDRYYNVFWNLYLLALDDEIYKTQLNDVIELASYGGFDEHMMRDWCRAVEYVMAGNKLSEDCDLECETVEGLKFFLHRDE